MKRAKTSLTVLILEDEPRVACSLARMLTRLGHTIIETGHIACAKQVFEEHTSIGAVLADFRMNDGDETGLDFIEWVKEKNPNIRCVLISGLALGHLSERIHSICDAFLTKPFDNVTLNKAITPTS